MRRQDKYKNIEQANLMMENHYLKSKGLLKESEDSFNDIKKLLMSGNEEGFYQSVYDHFYTSKKLDFEGYKNEYGEKLSQIYNQAKFRYEELGDSPKYNDVYDIINGIRMRVQNLSIF